MKFSGSGKFLCNICGTECERPAEGISREGASCPVCHSSARVRALIALLSEELLGVPMSLAEFPAMKGIRGIGMSDSQELAERLAKKLDYANTFYHQAPRFDVTHPDPADFGRFDFILTSEVMEHVPPPIEQAFANLFRLLKPEGVLIMTTPYSLGGKTREHFPDLHDFTLASPGGKTVLINRRRDGTLETFEDLVFHGGPGSTVEIRVFTEESLRENLFGAGFSSVRIASEDIPEFGIEHAETWSLPIAARKKPFHPPAADLSREYLAAHRLAKHLETELARLQTDYDAYVAHQKDWSDKISRESTERLEWGTALDRELTVRTEWAQGLDREIADLRRRLEAAYAEKTSIDARLWTKLGRRLGLLK
ncbi:MAG TPA: class I SAM-dependent methyltransferase [Bryobacteraceae bacterium]|nr:class I SAM-dependent methyltransferase [Bryobacteraceae bacterium]